MRNPRAVGVCVRVWGPSTVPLACMPCGDCVPRGWWGAVPGGGWPATAVRGVWCQALSLPRLPFPWGGRPGFRDPSVPVAIGAGVGAQRAPLRAGVARCGGGGEGVPGGAVFRRCEGRLGSGAPPLPAASPLGGLSGSATHVLWAGLCGPGGPCTGPVACLPRGGLRATGVAGGVWVQAPPLPCCPPSGRAAGARWPRAVGAGVGVCGVCGVCAVRHVMRGVAFRLSLWCFRLRCFSAVL